MTDAKDVPQAPVQALVVANGTGNGTGLSGMQVETPAGHPDIITTVITPFMAILVSAAGLYLSTLVGLITGGPATGLITASDFWHLLEKCSLLSVAPAGIDLLRNLAAYFTELGRKYPLLRL